jgi:hypothetical protein
MSGHCFDLLQSVSILFVSKREEISGLKRHLLSHGYGYAVPNSQDMELIKCLSAGKWIKKM